MTSYSPPAGSDVRGEDALEGVLLSVLIREFYRRQLRAAAETAQQTHRVQEAGAADLRSEAGSWQGRIQRVASEEDAYRSHLTQQSRKLEVSRGKHCVPVRVCA